MIITLVHFAVNNESTEYLYPKTTMNLATVRKMAAKKGAQIQFQTDVGNDEEWNKLLSEKTGLIVIDVYSDWCGPCTAMLSSLKKLKLEIGSDYLHFAVAKSSTVSVLQRFKNKSEPTWMFVAVNSDHIPAAGLTNFIICTGGHLVNLMFGVDAPALIQLIKDELEKEIEVLDKKVERKWIPFDELTQAEKDREAAMAKKQQEKLMEEQRKLAQKMNIVRERSLNKLAKLIPTHSCIIYFPYMIAADGSCAVAQKMMYLNDSISVVVVDQIQIQMDETLVEKIFFKCAVFDNFNERVKESLLQKPSMVTLLQTVITEEGSELASPRMQKTDYDQPQSIEQKLSKIVYGCENAVGYTEQSVAHEFIVVDETGVKLPPMWTPTNPLSKAAAIEVLFPRKLESVGYVPEELPPPQLIIIYDANKMIDLLDLIKIYRDEVYRIGFFDSVDPYNAKLICKTYEQFVKLPDEQVKNAKAVIALKKGDTEDLLFEFSQVIPFYISPNEKVGTEESEHFFPPDYYDYEEEITDSQNKDVIADEDEVDDVDINNFALDKITT